MKKIYTPNEIITDFIKYKTEQERLFYSEEKNKIGRGNRCADKAGKIIEMLKCKPEIREYVLKRILDCENPNSRVESAALILMYRIQRLEYEAITALEEISQDKSCIGFSAFTASYTLKMYRGEVSQPFVYYVDENGDLIDKETPSK